MLRKLIPLVLGLRFGMREGSSVQLARFVFLTMLPSAGASDGGVVWMLVSPNNRTLGRGYGMHHTYAACRAAVLAVRERHLECRPLVSNVDRTGQWSWRVELDDRLVAVSGRSYLRSRECGYNLERFLAALPAAEIVAGARTARRGRWHGVPAADPDRAQLTPAGAPSTDASRPAALRRNALR